MTERCEDILKKVIHFFETTLFFFVVVSLNVKGKINIDYNKQK